MGLRSCDSVSDPQGDPRALPPAREPARSHQRIAECSKYMVLFYVFLVVMMFHRWFFQSSFFVLLCLICRFVTSIRREYFHFYRNWVCVCHRVLCYLLTCGLLIFSMFELFFFVGSVLHRGVLLSF